MTSCFSLEEYFLNFCPFLAKEKYPLVGFILPLRGCFFFVFHFWGSMHKTRRLSFLFSSRRSRISISRNDIHRKCFVYHTGSEGEIRYVSFKNMMFSDMTWRPLNLNPSFLGYIRLKTLSY